MFWEKTWIFTWDMHKDEDFKEFNILNYDCYILAFSNY